MRCSGVWYIMKTAYVTKVSTLRQRPVLAAQAHASSLLLNFAANKHSMHLIWVFLIFALKHLHIRMQYNMFSYFKWVQTQQSMHTRTVLLHFFFEFCKVFALAASTRGNVTALRDDSFTGLTNYTFTSYKRRGSPLTISKGPMARKKRSREQYASFQHLSAVSFKLNINWERVGGICVTPRNDNVVNLIAGQQPQLLYPVFQRFETGTRAAMCYSAPLVHSAGLTTFFTFYLNYRVLLNAAVQDAGGPRYSLAFGGVFYSLYVFAFYKNKALSIDSNLAQLRNTARHACIFDVYFFANL